MDCRAADRTRRETGNCRHRALEPHTDLTRVAVHPVVVHSPQDQVWAGPDIFNKEKKYIQRGMKARDELGVSARMNCAILRTFPLLLVVRDRTESHSNQRYNKKKWIFKYIYE